MPGGSSLRKQSLPTLADTWEARQPESNARALGRWGQCEWVVQVAAAVKAAEQPSTACPPCQQMLPVSCHGGHVTSFQHCSRAAPFACQAACGKPLECGNHACAALCHRLDVSVSAPCIIEAPHQRLLPCRTRSASWLRLGLRDKAAHDLSFTAHLAFQELYLLC